MYPTKLNFDRNPRNKKKWSLFENEPFIKHTRVNHFEFNKKKQQKQIHIISK